MPAIRSLLTRPFPVLYRTMSSKIKYYDIGFNLTDPMYQGTYHGKKYHESDIPEILQRAYDRNVRSLLITGSSIEESQLAIKLANSLTKDETCPDIKLNYTIGVHPCCVNEFGTEDSMTIDNPSNDESFNELLISKVRQDPTFAKLKLHQLYDLVQTQLSEDSTKFRAFGEIGLDYDCLLYTSRCV